MNDISKDESLGTFRKYLIYAVKTLNVNINYIFVFSRYRCT